MRRGVSEEQRSAIRHLGRRLRSALKGAGEREKFDQEAADIIRAMAQAHLETGSLDVHLQLADDRVRAWEAAARSVDAARWDRRINRVEIALILTGAAIFLLWLPNTRGGEAPPPTTIVILTLGIALFALSTPIAKLIVWPVRLLSGRESFHLPPRTCLRVLADWITSIPHLACRAIYGLATFIAYIPVVLPIILLKNWLIISAVYDSKRANEFNAAIIGLFTRGIAELWRWTVG